MHFLPVHGVVRSWRRRGLSGQAKTYSRAYAYLKKRSPWMRCRSYRRQHLPIVSGITEAACKVVFTQRLKCSGMAWTRDGGQVILDLRVIRLSGVWEDVHQRYLASKPMPVKPKGTGRKALNAGNRRHSSWEWSDHTLPVNSLAGSHPRLKARVLLLDIDLPGLNGLGVLRRLAHDGVLQHTRVIMLTVRSAESEILEALELALQ